MPKPELITVLADTREQKPWPLDPNQFTVERATLRTGDYSIRGLEDRFVIERKSLGDFVGTVIGDWLRFRKELYRLASFDFAAVVVEADLSDVYAHRYESEANPESVIGRANAIYLDHGVPVFWWGSRSGCVRMVENLLGMAAKKLVGVSHGHHEAWTAAEAPQTEVQDAVQTATTRANQNARRVLRAARNRGEVHVPAGVGVDQGGRVA